MTIESATNRVTYVGSGGVGPFDIPFYFLNDADLLVIKTTIADGAEDELTLTTEYTVTGAGDPDGGTLTLVSSISSSYRLTIIRDPDILQPADYSPSDDFPAETHEQALDRLTMIAQRLNDLVSRSLRQPDGDSAVIGRLPSKVDRASMFLAFDSNGDPVAAEDAAGVPASSFWTSVLTLTTAALSRAGLGSTTVGDALFTAANAAAARTVMELGTLATLNSVGDANIDASTAQTLTDGANVSWALASGHVANWTIGGNRTLDNPSGVKRGRTYVLNVTQDATGGRTITFSSNYKGINGGAVPQPNPAATTTTSYLFYSPDGTVLQLIAAPVPVFGQCLLVKDGSNLKLSPLNGNLLTINGKVEVVPDAGVTLAVGALSNTTLYYVYAYMNSGTMTLEASTTAYATQAGANLKIKSGDATRTLVGMCYLQSGAFVSSLQKRLVRSWFNEPSIVGYSAGLNGTTGSGTFAEISTSFRIEALLWANETAKAVLTGYGNSGGANYVAVRAVRGAAAALGNDCYEGYSALYGGLCSQVADTPGEGYHYWNCYLYSGTGTSALVDADLTLTTARGA